MTDVRGEMTDVRGEQESARVRVWDPLVRLGHWILVAAFAVAYLTGGEPIWLHSWAGYAVAVTVLVRIVWGFIGPRRARFADFVAAPSRVAGYLRALVSGRAERHLGHSPAGGAMTIALLVALGVTAFSGMATLATEEGRGPLASIIALGEGPSADPTGLLVAPARADDDWDEAEGEEGVWKEIHEVAVNATLVLILLHLAGVALASFAHRENLVRAMITGRKRA